ncbi:hypothetical protein [Fructilactobacillus florum]|uniref:hypothetical protein n=1 Tax=Fructilactobacillus florum TaxID=640331 RepID=UPI0006D05AE1|nr:hypothetical protein [Fructilactobacillus florum]
MKVLLILKIPKCGRFFIAMIVLGIVGSLCSLAVGVEVSYTWIVFYELLAVVALFLPGTTLPFFSALFTHDNCAVVWR